jgi:hypothetical protein
MIQIKHILLLITAVGLSGACGKKIAPSIISHTGSYAIGAGTDTLQVSFMGTTCFYFEYHNTALLTDPFISNPPFRKVVFGKVRPDSAIIYDFITTEQLNKVRMITIGHAHYDHLLDLPEISKHIPATAKITGSATAHHIWAAGGQPHEKIVATPLAATCHNAGTWIYSADSTMRVMPVMADHPPHLLGITLYGGAYYSDLKKVPLRARKWKMGEPLAYLVDFFNRQHQIQFRIWIQTSGASYPKAFFPAHILNEKAVDVGIFSSATSMRLDDYPGRIVSYLAPRVIFLAHWEHFMRNKYKPVKAIPKGNQEKIYHYLKTQFGSQSAIVMPHPKSRFYVY